jgi:hypothetical protein
MEGGQLEENRRWSRDRDAAVLRGRKGRLRPMGRDAITNAAGSCLRNAEMSLLGLRSYRTPEPGGRVVAGVSAGWER